MWTPVTLGLPLPVPVLAQLPSCCRDPGSLWDLWERKPQPTLPQLRSSLPSAVMPVALNWQVKDKSKNLMSFPFHYSSTVPLTQCLPNSLLAWNILLFQGKKMNLQEGHEWNWRIIPNIDLDRENRADPCKAHGEGQNKNKKRDLKKKKRTVVPLGYHRIRGQFGANRINDTGPCCRGKITPGSSWNRARSTVTSLSKAPGPPRRRASVSTSLQCQPAQTHWFLCLESDGTDLSPLWSWGETLRLIFPLFQIILPEAW